MKSLLLLSSVIFAQPLLAEKACWDGTFGYNYARAEVTEKGLEISFEGNTLNLPPLALSNGQSLVFKGFSGNTPRFHVLIPKSAVKEEGNQISATVSGSLDDVFAGRVPALWVEHRVPDLDGSVEVLSPVPVLSLKARIHEEAIHLSFTQLWAYTKKGDYLTSSVKIACTSPTAPDELRIPMRLSEFLAKPAS